MGSGGPGARTPPVFHLPALPAGPSATLDGEAARHAVAALRMRSGEELVLADGRGSAARGEVTGVYAGKRPELTVSLGERWYEPAPALRVLVAQALIKGERSELGVELATEAGADALVPWQAERCVARWSDEQRRAKGRARWQAAATAAARVARRLWVPQIEQILDTEGLAATVARAAGAVLLEAEAASTLPELELPAHGQLVLIVGPEGGLAPHERDALCRAGARPARLGPAVLRASTAAAVALGALGAVTKRWACADPGFAQTWA